MIVPILGLAVSLVFLDLGLNSGNPFFLIGSLCLFGLSLCAIDHMPDRINARASDSLNALSRDRLGYYDDDRR